MDRMGSVQRTPVSAPQTAPGAVPAPGTQAPPPGTQQTEVAEHARQSGVLTPQQLKPQTPTQTSTSTEPQNDRATFSEEDEGGGKQGTGTLTQQPPGARGQLLGDKVSLMDLQRQSERKGDPVASRAFQELAQRDPDAQGVSRDTAPGADKTNLGFRTDSGYFLELQNRDETQSKSQGYRLMRFMEGDPTATAELYERQFDESGRIVYSMDQKTMPRPNGQLSSTERHYFDGEEYHGSVTEQETVFGFDLQSTPEPIKAFSGFQKFMSLLANNEDNVTYTQMQQRELPPEQAAPPPFKQTQQGPPRSTPFQAFARPTFAGAQPGMATPARSGPTPLPMQQQAPGAQPGNNNPTANILLNIATQGPDSQLAEPGQLYVLKAPSGLAMELFIPQDGKKSLAVRNRQGNVIYWEEEEDEEDDESGEQTRRRTAYDKTRKLKRYLEARRRQEQLSYFEESQFFYNSLMDLGLDGRETAAVWKIVKQFPNGIQEIIDEERGPAGGRRQLQRVQGEELLFVEHRTTQITPEQVVQSIQRTDIRRGRQGIEQIVTTPTSLTKEGSWHSDNVIYIQYALECYRKGFDRHKVMRYAQPSRNANGEVISHYDDGIGVAARLVRRQTNSWRTAADLVGPQGRHLMAGRKEDPACLEIEPTFHVSLRWETLQYPPLSTPDDLDATISVADLSFDAPECPQWMLQEDFSVYETRGVCRGSEPDLPCSFMDRVVMRRYAGFGGNLQKYIEVVSQKRFDTHRDALLSLIYLDGNLLAEAQGRAGLVHMADARDGLKEDMGLRLLERAGGESDLTLENVQSSHPPSGTRLLLQQFTVRNRPSVSVGRVARPRGPVPWWVRNLVPPLSAFQAFLTQTANTAWALNSGAGTRGEVQLGVDLPDCKVPVRASMWETTLEAASMADVDAVLQAHSLPPWDDLLDQNPSADRFDWRVRDRNDLVLLCRSVQGSREGRNFAGERVVLKTPEGDLLVLLNGDFIKRSFGYMRGREGDEHFTVPHPDSTDVLVLSSDESGVFGQTVDERLNPTNLGRLGEAFGGLLGWIESGRPLQRPARGGGEIPQGYQARLVDLIGAVRGVGRFPGPDMEAVKAVLWDFAHLGWAEFDDQTPLTEPYVLQLLAAGHSPLEAACLVLLGEFRRIKPDPEKLADLKIVI